MSFQEQQSFISDGSDTSSLGRRKSTKASRATKIGRKGDPRMHRAVNARIADPQLNLFDALKIGGFNYSDDDPNAIDSENITLTQRKNQLCRRIRKVLCPCGSDHLNTEMYCGNIDDTSFAGSETSRKKRTKFNRSTNHRTALSRYNFHSIIRDETNQATPCSFCPRDSDFQNINTQAMSDGRMLYGHGPADAPREKQPDQYSHLAISSLTKTAKTMGMTLDQLALALSNGNYLVPTVLPPSRRPEQSRQDFAISLYQSESQAMFQRAMLQAGYSPDIVHCDESAIYLQVAIAAWKHEGQRLRDHIDSLKSKGRTPVLHQPVGFAPHIDFVVDDFIECYHEAQFIDNTVIQNGKQKNNVSDGDPKVYGRNELTLDNEEWNLDFMSNDDLLNLLLPNDVQLEASQPV